MRIGIDISQLAYDKTGVANYLSRLVVKMVTLDRVNEYVLFYSSLRRPLNYGFESRLKNPKVEVKRFRIPPKFLDLLWNRLHILPIEHFIGKVDIFLTSDWTEPPTSKAKKASILYDLVVYIRPEETAESIVETQKRKHKWMVKESDMIFCISESAKRDAMEILGVEEGKLAVLYPGKTL